MVFISSSPSIYVAPTLLRRRVYSNQPFLHPYRRLYASILRSPFSFEFVLAELQVYPEPRSVVSWFLSHFSCCSLALVAPTFLPASWVRRCRDAFSLPAASMHRWTPCRHTPSLSLVLVAPASSRLFGFASRGTAILGCALGFPLSLALRSKAAIFRLRSCVPLPGHFAPLPFFR
jgi:hypothetical protein